MMKKIFKFIILCTMIPFLPVAFPAPEAWAGPPTDQLRQSIDRVIDVLNDPDLKTPDRQKERKVSLHRLVETIFDQEEVARRAMGKHWEPRTQEEKKAFILVFADLLESNYLERIDAHMAKQGDFSQASIVYLGEQVRMPYAIVGTKVVSGGNSEFRVDYKLKKTQERWQVCDIAIEGVSIVRNYWAQFREILARSSFPDFMAQLKAKQESIR